MAAADVPETTVNRSLLLTPSRFSGPISGEDYQFTAAYAKDAMWARGLRDFLNIELGIQAATGGQFKACSASANGGNWRERGRRERFTPLVCTLMR